VGEMYFELQLEARRLEIRRLEVRWI